MPENIAADRLALLRLIDGYRVTQVLVTSVELGLPDLLAAGPRPCAELAREAGAEADSLYRLLRTLVALGVLEEGGDGVFGLTGMGRGLASDAQLSLRDWTEWEGRDQQQATWRKLRESVRTGRPAEAAAPASGEAGSFALADEHMAWLRQVRGQALFQGTELSQSDVVRAAVQAMIGTEWKALRADLDARARPRGRGHAEGGEEGAA